MPSARSNVAAAGSTDIFSVLGKMVQQATYPTSTTRDAQVDDLTQTGSLIPPSLSGAERSEFVNTQRDHLQTLLQAFDREAGSSASYSSAMPPPTSRNVSGRKSYLAANDGPPNYPMHKSRSDSEFEDLAYEPMPDPDSFRPPPPVKMDSERRSSGNGWSNMIWGNYGQKDSAINPRKDM